MKGIFLIIIFLVNNYLYAQQSYFNSRLNITGYDLGFSIIQLDTSYLLIVAKSDTNFNILKFQSINLDLNGIPQSEIDFTCYPNSYFVGGFGGLVKNGSSNFIMVGSTTLYGSLDPIIYNLDSSGDTISTRVFIDTLNQSGYHIVKNRFNGYYFTGQTNSQDPNGNVLLMAIDSAQNFLWKKEYGGLAGEIGFWIDTTIDGGIIIAGNTQSFGGGASPRCGNTFIIKTDNTGNQQWMKYFGGPYNDGAFVVIQCKDSTIAIGGFYSVDDPAGTSTCDLGISQPWIMKLDLNGNIIWDKKYGPPIYDTYINCMRELENGDLIATGAQGDDSLATHAGLILKVKSNGDNVFYRTYKNIYGFNSDNFLQDIRSTSDSGFIACGFLAPYAPDTGLQDTWILKIDSNGCEQINCNLSSTIYELTNKNKIVFYPNPSIGKFSITNKEEIKSIDIFDVFGHLLIENNSSDQIDLSDYSSGTYFYRVENRKGTFLFGKLMKE